MQSSASPSRPSSATLVTHGHAHHVPWLAYGCLAASTSVIGSYVGLSKLLVAVFPVFLLAWLRFGMAAVIMMPWLARTPDEGPMSRRTKGLLFLLSFFGNFLFSICMLFGVRHSSAVVAGVVMAGIPAAVALLSFIFLRERIGARVLAGIALAVSGIALVALNKQDSGAAAQSGWGALLLLGAVLCEGSYVVIGKRLTQALSAKRISALINLWGLALVTPLGIWQALVFNFGAVDVKHWGLLLFYAVAASMITVWLWMQGLRHVSAPKAGVFMVFLPISTAVIGVVFLGETMSSLQLLAYALALGGVVLATWPNRVTSGGAITSAPITVSETGTGKATATSTATARATGTATATATATGTASPASPLDL
ncbi:Threonine/homoserine efflux transporter RhtA [Roseateles sp. YR242]|uniref:DMT family transporter n=1 Tax=Roseateles sp. YR242 TaxID=1855305 RepID=UPI0008CC2CB4|nr:DMT family transporter [Roseateles sp. YR242]SEL60915.1 Threonine/homoserine efflux transporter RhtA [Roseateles sp. YR242]